MSRIARLLARRRLLKVGLGVTVITGLGLGASLIACARRTTGQVRTAERLRVVLATLPAPARIGAACCAGRTLGEIAVEISGRPGLVRALQTDCPETRHARLRTLMRADFAAGDFVVADRFVISRTEGIAAGFLWAAGMIRPGPGHAPKLWGWAPDA